MEHVFEFLGRKSVDVLPEPLNELILRLAGSVPDVILQVLKVDVLLTIDDHIELIRFKD